MKFAIGTLAGALTYYIARTQAGLSGWLAFGCCVVVVFVVRGVFDAAWRD